MGFSVTEHAVGLIKRVSMELLAGASPDSLLEH